MKEYRKPKLNETKLQNPSEFAAIVGKVGC